jgi:predicted nucleic acid-binding protein
VVALLDSVAVVGFLDRDDAFHSAADGRIRQLAGREVLVVSVITYAELLTGAGLGHHEQSAVRGFFDQLIDEIVSVDRAVAERAAGLRSQDLPLKMPDALILATADVHQADLVITGDERWSAVGISPPVEVLAATATEDEQPPGESSNQTAT